MINDQDLSKCIILSKQKEVESCQGTAEVWQQTLSLSKSEVYIGGQQQQPPPRSSSQFLQKKQITFKGHALWRCSSYFCIVEVFKSLLLNCV